MIFNAEAGLHDSINGALADLSFDSTARPSLAPSRQSRAQDASDSLDLSFVHSSHPDLDQFHPVAAYYLPPARDEGMLIAHADIGFLAFASGASLVVVDLRERGVMLCELAEDKGEKDKGKNKVDKSAISSLKFTVCSTSLDSDNTPRLIVCYGSGTMRVFKLEQVANRWTTKPKLTTLARDSLVHAIFVLDRNGEEIQANSIALQNAKVSPHSHNSAIIPSLCITVAPGSVSTLYGIDGSRIAHYQNSGGKLFGRAFLVRRFGCPALVTFSKEREITLLSLPMLVPITKFNFESALQCVPSSLRTALIRSQHERRCGLVLDRRRHRPDPRLGYHPSLHPLRFLPLCLPAQHRALQFEHCSATHGEPGGQRQELRAICLWREEGFDGS